MNIIIDSDSLCGIGQTERGTGLQDAYYAISRPNGFFVALTDGASCAKYAAQGAEITARCVATALESDFPSFYKTENSEISKKIMMMLDSELDLAAKKNNTERRELASTLMFAACDGKHFLLGHLGDGVIMGLYAGNATVISFPDSDGGNGTYLTSTWQADTHLRIYKGNVEDYEGIILITDGMAENAFFELYIPRKNLPLNKLLHTTIKEPHRDDASFVIVKWRNDDER